MKHQQPTLRFRGATDTVTGSRYLVEAGGKRVLGDYGLFQGYKRSRERNRSPCPVPDPKSAIILSGYQAPGTRGAALAAGARGLHSYGEGVPIRAQVIEMENLSAHADAAGRVAWLTAAEKEPRMTCITHGEPEASEALRVRIKRQLGWRARAPGHRDKISLEVPR